MRRMTDILPGPFYKLPPLLQPGHTKMDHPHNKSHHWGPHEKASHILMEKIWLQGALFCDIIYGVEVALFALCFKLVVNQMDRRNWRKKAGLLVFVTVLFILATIDIYGVSAGIQQAFIKHRDYPGGPGVYEMATYWEPVGELGTMTRVISNWLMDLLLVWRCVVIYTPFRGMIAWTALMPCLLFLSSFSLGIVFLAKTAGLSPFHHSNFTLTYFCASLALNIIVTACIVARLLTWRARLEPALGARNLSHYSRAAAILIESASLYSIFVIPLVATIALHHPLAIILVLTVCHVQTVSSLLIIYQVTTRRGAIEGTSTPLIVAPRSDDETFIVQLAPPVRELFAESSATMAQETIVEPGEVYVRC